MQIDFDYLDLVQEILKSGHKKETRNGNTYSIFGKTIRHSFKQGFPLLTTKKISFKNVLVEALWFLSGRTDINFLIDNGCNIWNGDAHQYYLKKTNNSPESLTEEEFINELKTNKSFNQKYSNLGKIYGYNWRNYNGTTDQIQEALNQLTNNPNSRRILVNTWNPSELNEQALPPCHYSFQFYSHKENGENKLSLIWNQRSVDVGLGLPYNIASYAIILEIFCRLSNHTPHEIIGNLGDTHIYENHIEGLTQQLQNEPIKVQSTLNINTNMWSTNQETNLQAIQKNFFQKLHKEPTTILNSFKLENYFSHGKIFLPLSN